MLTMKYSLLKLSPKEKTMDKTCNNCRYWKSCPLAGEEPCEDWERIIENA